MHPLDSMVVGCWTYAPGDCENVLRGFHSLSAAAPRELITGFRLASAALVLTACWSGAPAGAEAAIAPFGNLAPLASGSFGSMACVDLQKRNDVHLAWGQRYYSKGGFLGNIDDAAITSMNEAIASSPTANSDIYMLQLGGAVKDKDENATPYSGRVASYNWITSAIWDDAADDGRCMAWGRKAAASLAAISLRGNYVNEQSDFGKDVAFGAYGREKYDRLARLKARIDPANLFRLNQNIEPKT